MVLKIFLKNGKRNFLLSFEAKPFFASACCFFSVFLFVFSSFILFAFSFRFLLKTTKVAFKL